MEQTMKPMKQPTKRFAIQPTSIHSPRARGAFHRLRAQWPILVAVVATGMFGCSDSEEHFAESPRVISTPVVSVTEPAVEIDLPELSKTGVLRVLLLNSSSSYYVMRGEEWGFEFELAREVARDMGLRIKVVLPDSQAAPLDLLNRGQVDLVAMPLRPEEAPEAQVSYTAPYHTVQQIQVVNSAYADSITGPVCCVHQVA